ncbi:MAG TPA: acyl carrier protein [Hanamia sp.]|nr:acyl carrier protein [Hanamia sp.]
MEQDVLLKDLNKIFIDVFEDESIKLNENTTTSDIESWDSLNHIQMITAVEKHYKIRFNLNELLNFRNVGDLCRSIQTK